MFLKEHQHISNIDLTENTLFKENFRSYSTENAQENKITNITL